MNPNDKDSVALLLALRQSGSDASNPGSWNALGESSTHSASYPKGVQVRDEPPTTTVGRNIGKGWMTGHGAVPSPASSGGHEDDHSQRLYVSLLGCMEGSLMIDLTTGYQPMPPWQSAL